MPVDKPRQNNGSVKGHIVLFDLGENGEFVANPIPIQALPLTHGIDNLAVRRESNGTYLIWINGGGGDITKFYRTNITDLRDNGLSMSLVQNWNPNSSADFNGKGK